MQEFLSATSGIDEMLRMLNDYLIFDLREQYSQVRFRDEKESGTGNERSDIR